MKYSDKQIEVINAVMEFVNSPKSEISVGGMAGTGKTTISKEIINRLGDQNINYLVLTPTGKAANVLRSKGVAAETIHSAIYNFKGRQVDEEAEEEFLVWQNKDEIKGSPKILVVDEASMVNQRLADDLRSLGLKIIWIGDHGQLPPVGKDPYIMRIPDFVLTEIFRQKQGNGIIDFAYDARKGRSWATYNNVSIMQAGINQAVNMSFDQAICGRNHTRRKFNNLFRKKMGYKKLLEPGEKIIVVHNNRRLGLFNGMLLKVEEILAFEEDRIHAVITTDDAPENKRHVFILRDAFGATEYQTEGVPGDSILCDYGYCITCHKSQGSEWPNVLVIYEEAPAWDIKRWLYTAATRAKENLTVIYQ